MTGVGTSSLTLETRTAILFLTDCKKRGNRMSAPTEKGIGRCQKRQLTRFPESLPLRKHSRRQHFLLKTWGGKMGRERLSLRFSQSIADCKESLYLLSDYFFITLTTRQLSVQNSRKETNRLNEQNPGQLFGLVVTNIDEFKDMEACRKRLDGEIRC